MQGGHILCEKQSENTQQPSTYSVAYPGAATTLIDTFAEHIGTKCNERENPSLGYKSIFRLVYTVYMLFMG